MQMFFKILIGLSPIWCVCICVGPMWQIKHVLRQISSCSCIFHRCCILLHVRCLTDCPSDIFVLNWTQVSPFAWVYSWLTIFNMFWSMNVFYTLCPSCALMPCLAHTMHPLDTPHAPPAALTSISICIAQTHTCIIMYFMHCASVYMF